MVLLTTAACTDAARHAVTPASLAGCYTFARRDSPSVSVRHRMPDTVMLDTAAWKYPDSGRHPPYPYTFRPRSHRPGAGRDTIQLDSVTAVPYPHDWDRTFVTRAWRMAPGNRVLAVLYQNMGSSWDYRLKVRGDSLVGVAEYFDDGPVTFTIPLVARRVECPAGSATPIRAGTAQTRSE